MKTVHRVDLYDAFHLGGQPISRTMVSLPVESRVLHVELQDKFPKHPCMWVELDTSLPSYPAEFLLAGTGHEIPDGWDYLGTWQQDSFVWHLYQRGGHA